jgi:hypothetical protein
MALGLYTLIPEKDFKAGAAGKSLKLQGLKVPFQDAKI